ncbi:serine acetyltransferase [Romboutsia timonensis]|uniref:serine O-acetyltransferase n=1 Tax=Romboutsia timonensis TaxID=1776391 RepID=UPI002A8024E0|nr:serine acetyltransferase [Romboutsia timonensis]MDY3959685.1 serine acetyltransferase [Romboutsia timonensis]
MIKTKDDYYQYIEHDKNALGISRHRPRIFADEIWKFQRIMRKYEYINNCKKGILWIPIKKIMQFKYKKISMRLGFSIPINTFGPGLAILHRGTIVVNGNAKIGANCRINIDVNIGTQMGYKDACPTIGNNVFIGPGAKLFNKITVGDNVAIGANSVVNKNIPDNVSIAGIPAKIINNRGTQGVFAYYLD